MLRALMLLAAFTMGFAPADASAHVDKKFKAQFTIKP